MIKWIKGWLEARRERARDRAYQDGFIYAWNTLKEGGTPLWWDPSHPFDQGVWDAMRQWDIVLTWGGDADA